LDENSTQEIEEGGKGPLLPGFGKARQEGIYIFESRAIGTSTLVQVRVGLTGDRPTWQSSKVRVVGNI